MMGPGGSRQRQIEASGDGHLAAVWWARALDDDRVWAVEAVGMCPVGSSRRCWQRGSGSSGWRRIGWARRARASAQLASRTRSTPLAVARAVVKDGVDEFPVAFLDEQAMEIRLLLDHRSDLVAERTRTINRVRWHLLELCPEVEASLKRKALNRPRTLTASIVSCAASRPERALGSHTNSWPTCANSIDGSTRSSTSSQSRPRAPTAAAGRTRLRPADRGDPDRPHRRQPAIPLRGRVRGAVRYRPSPVLIRAADPAPAQPRRRPPAQPCAAHHRRDPRQTRPGHQDYLVRKEAEGQTTKGALRCLKRHLARRFHHLLSQPPLTPTDDHNTTKQSRHRREHRRDNVDTTIIGAAPMPIPCGS